MGVMEMLIDCPAGRLKGKYVLEEMEVDGAKYGISLLG